MTVADQIAGWLYEKDIRHVFGIIGGGNVAIFDAIARLGKTQIVCVHHEQAAVMAAVYYYRASGRISCALVTTGAGSTNAITGVVAAWMDSAPVIVLSGNEASRYMEAPTRVWGVQGYGSMEMVKAVTKCAIRPPVEESMSALRLISAIALARRQGPVWVDLTKDVQNAVVG